MTTANNPTDVLPIDKSEDINVIGFFNQPRAGGKSIWDWMQLLIIPFVLVAVRSLFSYQQNQTSLQVSQKQHEADQQQALDQQQAVTLQTYIDNIQDLLLNHNLLSYKQTDDIAILARARTITALQGLDPHRKGVLVQFLYDARLIGYGNPTIGGQQHSIISLFNVDIANANLFDASLFGATLFGTTLTNTNLSYATLIFADLTDADLAGANLTKADLTKSTLKYANLAHANLTNANLSNADLSNALQLHFVGNSWL